MIQSAVVFFWLTIIVPGERPVEFQEPVASLAECLGAVTAFLTHPSHRALVAGGQVAAGCELRLKPSVEH